MKIKIFSRRQIEELLREGFPEKTAVISFYDPETSRFIAEDYRPVMTLICLFSRSMV